MLRTWDAVVVDGNSFIAVVDSDGRETQKLNSNIYYTEHQ